MNVGTFLICKLFCSSTNPNA